MPEIPSQPVPALPFNFEPVQEEESLNIREYLALFWQWAWLIALAGLLAGAAAYLVSSQITPVYQIATTLLVNEAPSSRTTDYNSLLASERLTRTYSQMIASEDVLLQAASELDLAIPLEDLQEMVSVQPVRDTQLIQIQVESSVPTQAVALANQLVTVFASQIQEIQTGRFSQSKTSLEAQMADVQSQIDDYAAQLADSSDPAEKDNLESKITDYRQIYSTLLQSYEQVRLSEAQSISSVVQIQSPIIPADPVRPKKLQNTLLAAVLGVLLASGAVVGREALDDTLKTPEDIGRTLGLPVLGVIGRHEGQNGSLATLAAPRSPAAEAFRTLRTNVQYASVDKPLQRLLITSTEPGEGKTTIAANLAVALAQSGKQVALLDCDFRRPTLHRRLALSNHSGLSQLFFEQSARPERLGQTGRGGRPGRADQRAAAPQPGRAAQLQAHAGPAGRTERASRHPGDRHAPGPGGGGRLDPGPARGWGAAGGHARRNPARRGPPGRGPAAARQGQHPGGGDQQPGCQKAPLRALRVLPLLPGQPGSIYFD